MSSGITGSLTELHRWPVKSMGGEPARALRLDGRGIAGDRTHALFDVHQGAPRRLTARQAPRMLAWRADYPASAADDALVPEDPPEPTLTAPDGRAFAWSDPELPRALREDLGRPVTLRADVAGQQDLADSVLVTTQATLDAVAEALCAPVDLRRFRTNLHVVMDAPAFAELAWEGRTLWVGEAQLELLHPCVRCVIPTRDPDTQEKWSGLLRHLTSHHDRCFGINARPTGAATIRVGDAVRLI